MCGLAVSLVSGGLCASVVFFLIFFVEESLSGLPIGRFRPVVVR